jgi:hypothetical protein
MFRDFPVPNRALRSVMNLFLRKQRTPLCSVSASRARRPRRLRPALDALEGRMLLSFFGSEAPVNPPTGSNNFGVANASSPNGTSVAVWVKEFTPTDHDIFAQLYDKSGAKVGPEIVVDASVNDSLDPSVAMDSQGNFVVTWRDFFSATGNSAVLARYFNASGVSTTGAFTVANFNAPELSPDVAASNGSFVVTYTLDFSPTDQDVRAHRYTVSGGVVTDAGDFAVADTSAANESFARVAMAPNGSFDIAYQSALIGRDSDILLNRFSPSGAAIGPAVIVQNSALNEISPDVAIDNAGNAVVVYQKSRLFDSNSFDVKARRVFSNGLVGQEIDISSNPTVSQTAPSVALAPTGGKFVVSYDIFGLQPIPEIAVAEVSATDQLLETLGPVSGSGSSVSIDNFNRYLVTYTKVDGTFTDTFSRRGLLPSFAGSEAVVNALDNHEQFSAANASSANGTSVVVWVSGTAVFNHDILAQRFGKNGEKVGPVIPVDVSAADSTEPAVAMDANGNFVVAWTDGRGSGKQGDVRVRYFNAAGSPLTPALTVAATPLSEHNPAVALSAGSFVVSYTRDISPTHTDVRAHRFIISHSGVSDAGDFAVANAPVLQDSSSIAMAPDGSFDIAYAFTTSGVGGDLRLNRYSASGKVLASGVIVASSASGAGELPDIAMDLAGNAVIAYEKIDPITGHFDIKARRVSKSGVVGGEIDVRSTSRDEQAPSVALAPTGGQFVVASFVDGQSEVTEVSATDQVKAVLGPVDGSQATVSIDGLGRYLVTYHKQGPNGHLDIFSRRDFLS